MTKGDWAYTCLEDLKLLNISESLENIQTMTKSTLSKLLKQITKLALSYLTGKQRSKGKEIE